MISDKKRQNIILQANIVVVAVFLISIIITVLLYLPIRNKIKNKLKKIIETITEVSQGNLKTIYVQKKVNCSKISNCGDRNCIEYGKLTGTCFISAGSYGQKLGKEVTCRLLLSGKYKVSDKCPVFKKMQSDEIDEMGININEASKANGESIQFRR